MARIQFVSKLPVSPKPRSASHVSQAANLPTAVGEIKSEVKETPAPAPVSKEVSTQVSQSALEATGVSTSSAAPGPSSNVLEAVVPSTKVSADAVKEVTPPDLFTEGTRLTEGRKLARIGARMLEQHRYAEAVSVLSSAVDAFPPGTRDLSYGYALYRLGYALRISGQAADAMPILQRAMQFALIRSQASREMQTATLEAERLNASGHK